MKPPTEVERPHAPTPGSPPADISELARLLTAVLAQVRNDPLLRPPPLPQPALDAILAYEVASGAVNPGRNPVFNETITTPRSKP